MTVRPRSLPTGLAAVAAATLLLLAAILANGRPTVFTDTDDYYSLGQEIADAVMIPLTGHPADAAWRADPADAAADAHMARTQMGARSVAYALFVYPAHQAGTLWLLAAIQSALAAWLLWLVWGVATPRAGLAGYLLMASALAVGSTLPFFAGFAMPDIFAALALLAAALLFVAADRLSPATRVGLVVLLIYALAVHTSHVLVGALLLAPAWPLMRWQGVAREVAGARLATVGGALVVAVLVGLTYAQFVLATTGEPLRRPPFLVSRLLADGPGRDYLRAACAGGARPYQLCAFKAAPLDDAEHILWNDPPDGIFNPSSYAVRTALEDEEARFVIGTLRHDPLGELRAALGNWWRQAQMVEVDDPVRDPVYFLTDPYWRQTNLPELVQAMGGCGRDGHGCALRLTAAASRAWHGGIVVVAVAGIAAGLAQAWRQRRHGTAGDRRLPALALYLVAGVVVNAAVCGMLSGPYSRYQARLAWLLPLVALLFAANWWQRRRAGAAESMRLLTSVPALT